MDTRWEDQYPMVSVRALERIEKLSDHASILLTTGLTRPLSKKLFKFELGWLQREGFHEMVKNMWERPVYANNPVIRWNKRCELFVNTFLDGRAIQLVFLKRRSFVYHLS
jgi:hypothetical protein